MLLLFWVLLFLVGACLILLMPAIWGKQIYNTYRDIRTTECPETHAPVSVRFNALRAAITGLSGQPRLRLADCSRWPERADCGQDCIPAALRDVPPVEAPGPAWYMTFPHLPAIVAAAAAWVLGMAWHSEYLFRPQWMAAVALTDRQTRDLAEMWSPHLLTVGACLFFAYGTALIVSWLGTRTVFLGIRVALAVWLVMAAAVLVPAWSTLSRALIRIEGGYTLLAALLVGGIIGTLPMRVYIKDPA